MIIYMAKNLFNGKVYIGQTAYTLEKRKAKHISMRNSSGYYFHNALAKYGPDNFDWEILCECRTKEELSKMEIFYISKFKSNNKIYGYNMTDGGESPLGRKHKLSSRLKMANSHKEVRCTHTEEWNRKIGASQIGSRNHMYGKVGAMNPTSKRFKITDPEGNTFEIIGLSDFCRKNNLHDSIMAKVANGKRNHHKGYKCERLEDK